MEMIVPAIDEMHAVGLTGANDRLHGWELKNKVMHRGVLSYKVMPDQTVAEVEAVVRSGVLDMYEPSWNQGFAFGALLQFEMPPDFRLEVFDSVVDAYSNSKGVWQWIIAVNQQEKTAYARHMWMEGALHGHFKKTIAQLADDGYSIKSTYAERPNFFSHLSSLMSVLSKAKIVLSWIGFVLALIIGALIVTGAMK